MKNLLLLTLAISPAFLCSCAHSPAKAYHLTSPDTLVIESNGENDERILQPQASGRITDDEVFNAARQLPQHQTAVVILENYNEKQLGADFHNRGTLLFMGLRNLGYKDIYFLRGQGSATPEGLTTLAEYH